MITPIIKVTCNPKEWEHLHPKVKSIYEVLFIIFDQMGYELEVTSMLRRANTIPGESNVHATGRALDCVPRRKKWTERIIRADEYKIVSSFINFLYPRKDNKSTCLWHDRGLGFHYHVQVPFDPKYLDLLGAIPFVAPPPT